LRRTDRMVVPRNCSTYLLLKKRAFDCTPSLPGR
jgi:hypothetical protein